MLHESLYQHTYSCTDRTGKLNYGNNDVQFNTHCVIEYIYMRVVVPISIGVLLQVHALHMARTRSYMARPPFHMARRPSHAVGARATYG